MEGLRRGDVTALEAAYQAYRPRIFGFLARMCRSRDQAEDLLQEVFLSLARSGVNLAPGTRLLPWLFVVARNAFLSARRSARLSFERLHDLALFRSATAEWISPFDLSSASEAQRSLEAAVAALPLASREALLLVAEEGLGYEEAAAVLGISAEALRQRLSRARAELRAKLEKSGKT